MGRDDENRKAVERDADRFNREHHQRHHPAGVAEVTEHIAQSADQAGAYERAGESNAYAQGIAEHEIGRLLKERQYSFETQLGQAMYRTQMVGEAMAARLGQISKGEAVDALKRFVGEELERLR